MTNCYECNNYNHVDCVCRKPKSKKKCNCWCTKKDSTYNLIMNKTRVKEQ